MGCGPILWWQWQLKETVPIHIWCCCHRCMAVAVTMWTVSYVNIEPIQRCHCHHSVNEPLTLHQSCWSKSIWGHNPILKGIVWELRWYIWTTFKKWQQEYGLFRFWVIFTCEILHGFCVSFLWYVHVRVIVCFLSMWIDLYIYASKRRTSKSIFYFPDCERSLRWRWSKGNWQDSEIANAKAKSPILLFSVILV